VRNRPQNDRPVPCTRSSTPHRLKAIKPSGVEPDTLPAAFENKPHRLARLDKLDADARAVFGVIANEASCTERPRMPADCGPCLSEGRASGLQPTWGSRFASFALWCHPCLVSLHP
jgi:hypothetical protein